MKKNKLKQKHTNIQKKYNDLLELAESIQNYISEHDCPTMSMDISHLNIFDASKITALWSTYHWTKYPHGKITLKTNSDGVKTLTNHLDLGNVKLINVQ